MRIYPTNLYVKLLIYLMHICCVDYQSYLITDHHQLYALSMVSWYCSEYWI